MMWYSSDGWGWAHWIVMTVGMVAFWGLIITAIILAIDYLSRPRGSATSPQSFAQARATDVLTERYARGEIGDDEYRQRLTLLREHL